MAQSEPDLCTCWHNCPNAYEEDAYERIRQMLERLLPWASSNERATTQQLPEFLLSAKRTAQCKHWHALDVLAEDHVEQDESNF